MRMCKTYHRADWFTQSDCAKLAPNGRPEVPGDVLAQPTRAWLFARLGELGRPASTDELARSSGCIATASACTSIASRAGLIVRERERRPQGRPRDAWSINPDAQPGGDPPTAYADLGRWLVREHRRRKTRVRGCRVRGAGDRARAGRRGAAGQRRSDARRARRSRLPAHEHDRPRGRSPTPWRNCPYRDAVRENQTVVCALHRGLTRGLLDEMSPRTELAGFVPKDPYAAGCLIQLKGPLADEAARSTPSLSSPAPRRGPAARR